MIEFINISKSIPYLKIIEYYERAIEADQKNIEAISIASFNSNKNEVDSRYVNLKFIDEDNFIFFTNYNSPKSLAFELHDQISACLFWSSINIQIRMKAKIKKTSKEFNKRYFKERSNDKNALAISSDQSKIISSYEEVIKKYQNVSDTKNLSDCPDYWGGYSFKPYEIEFWEGHKSRINKRDFFELNQNRWHHSILEP